MKNKKKITEAVLAANRANAQSSTGPRTERGKSNSQQNAVRHGILAKSVLLETDEERLEYRRILDSWNSEFGPEGFLENVLVEELTTLGWKLQIVEGPVIRELARRQNVRGQVHRVFHGDLKLPISDSDLPLSSGWECERIVVRAVSRTGESNSSTARGPAVAQNQVISAVQSSRNRNTQEAGHLEVEAVLVSSLEKMTRYQSALKRDLYRAIETLRVLQADRRKSEDG